MFNKYLSTMLTVITEACAALLVLSTTDIILQLVGIVILMMTYPIAEVMLFLVNDAMKHSED